jgi:Zn-dependent M32 family carboxypeptidase
MIWQDSHWILIAFGGFATFLLGAATIEDEY